MKSLSSLCMAISVLAFLVFQLALPRAMFVLMFLFFKQDLQLSLIVSGAGFLFEPLGVSLPFNPVFLVL